MRARRSKRAAVPERPRIASRATIVALAALVMALLAAVYPHEALVHRISHAPDEPLTEAYLDNLLRADPENPELRLALARRQLNEGLFDRVRETLAPALAASDTTLRRNAYRLLWQSDAAKRRTLPENSPLRRATLNVQRRNLAELGAHEEDDEFLADIACEAITIGETRLGLDILARLAGRGGGIGPVRFDEAAREALAVGDYRAAAGLYLLAAERAATFSEARRRFLQAMHALESGNLPGEALSLAGEALDRHPALANDIEVLELLVRFARASRRPALADRYARRLLQLSWTEWMRRARHADSPSDVRLMRVAFDGGKSAPARAGEPQRPFSDRIYTLGFEAFLDNRNLEDAWRVAASAVHHAPDSPIWRQRLAEVSEWSGRPRAALDQWLYLARQRGDDADWQAVLRLAPGLLDDEALREALEHHLARHPDDGTVLDELVAVYERLGNPQGALRILERAFARSRRPALLERMAEIAANAGDDDRALDLWIRLIDADGPTPARALRAVPLLIMRNRIDAAMDILQRTQDALGTAPAEAAFWRLAGDVARLRQKDSAALGAYRRLVELPDATARDYAAVIELLRDDHPREAADLAAASWRRFGDPAHLLDALQLYASTGNWQEAGRLINALDGKHRALLRQRSDFLRISARYHQTLGHIAQARRDLDAALRLDPDDAQNRAAAIWFAIDTNDRAALEKLLVRHETAWRADPELHDALGAAHMALSHPAIALRRYYTPHLAEHRDDFLWMMNYADALEQNRETDRAWQLREFLLARQHRGSVTACLPGEEETVAIRRAARARLIALQRSGDPAYAALRELLRLDRTSATSAPPAVRELVLTELNDRGEHAAARAWLWQQYAHNAGAPAWARAALALAENDHETAGQLLQGDNTALAPQERISLAADVGDVRRLQTEAFDLQEDEPDDDLLHGQLSDALLSHADAIGGTFVRRDIGSFVETTQSAVWHRSVSPTAGLDIAGGHIRRTSLDRADLGAAFDESFQTARLSIRHGGGETRLFAEHRHSLDDYAPLAIEHEHRLGESLSLAVALARHQSNDTSAVLRVAGMKNVESVGLTYRPDRNARLGIGYEHDSFALQTGQNVGAGTVRQFEAAFALRGEPRDVEGAVFGSDHRFSRQDDSAITTPSLNRLLPGGVDSAAALPANFFLPDDFRFYGIRIATGTRFERDYTRSWRPFASVARTWHSEMGPGYDLFAGIAGSVSGNDHLSLGWRLAKGGIRDTGRVHEIGLTYRLHY